MDRPGKQDVKLVSKLVQQQLCTMVNSTTQVHVQVAADMSKAFTTIFDGYSSSQHIWN